MSSEKPCFGIKPYELDPQSGMFREISLVHLKGPTRTARNNRSLQVSLRWEVLGCIPHPTEQRKSLSHRERRHIPRLLCSPSMVHSGLQLQQPQVLRRVPGQRPRKPGSEGRRLPARPLGHLPRGRLLRTSSLASGEQSASAHPPRSPERSPAGKVRQLVSSGRAAHGTRAAGAAVSGWGSVTPEKPQRLLRCSRQCGSRELPLGLKPCPGGGHCEV